MEAETEEFTQANAIPRLKESGLFTGDTRAGLEKLRKNLLDLGKRNRLLNFTHPKASLRLIDEMPDYIFEELLSGEPLLLRPVPEPDLEEMDDEEREAFEKLATHERLRYVAEEIEGLETGYELPVAARGQTHARHTDPELQTLHFPEQLEALASTICRAAHLAIEETGSNMCYLALGFLEWDEDRDPSKKYLAPLMLMPITLTKGVLDEPSGTYRYAVTYNGDDMMPNLSLIEFLKHNASIAFPEIEEGELPESYWSRCEEVLQTKPRWKIRRYATISLFQFQKLLMYLDLEPGQMARRGVDC